MKKLVFSLIAAMLTLGSFGQKKENNTELALQRTLMVATVEMLQKTVPAGVTAADFNRQLVEAKSSSEGILFLNKAFDYYKKGTSTQTILNTYDGKESKAILFTAGNGNVNPFGGYTNPQITGKDGKFWAWLHRTAVEVGIFLAEVAEIIITVVNIGNSLGI